MKQIRESWWCDRNEEHAGVGITTESHDGIWGNQNSIRKHERSNLCARISRSTNVPGARSVVFGRDRANQLMRKLHMGLPWKVALNPFQDSPINETTVTTAYQSIWMSYIVQIGFGILLLLVCVIITYRRKQMASSGPKHWPIIGSMFAISSNYHHMHDWLVRFFLRRNTICAPMPFGRLYYCTVDPANVKHLLDMNSINYRKGRGFFKRVEELLGSKEHHDTSDMKIWTGSGFSGPCMSEMSADALKESTCTVAGILAEVAFGAGLVDVQELLRRASLDAVGKVALGIDFASVPHRLGSKWPEGHIAFVTALDSATEIVTKRFSDPLWELKRYLKIGQEGILAKQIEVMDDFIYKIIDDRTCEVEKFDGQLYDLAQAYRATDDGTPYDVRTDDLVTKYLTFNVEDETSVHFDTDVLLRHIVMNFMVASRDATAATLTWFVYLMSRNPIAAHKLYEELREFHARRRSPGDSPLTQEWDEDLDLETYNSTMASRIRDYAKLLTPESFDELPYLHACVHETLRLYPIVPLDTMDIEADDILPDGFALSGRNGNMMFVAPYAMARMVSIWGPDAASFNPQRWLHKGKLVQESECKFVTFQAGLYTASLRNLIYGSCQVAAAVLGRFFEFVYSAPVNYEPQYRMATALIVENGLKVYPRLRD